MCAVVKDQNQTTKEWLNNTFKKRVLDSHDVYNLGTRGDLVWMNFMFCFWSWGRMGITLLPSPQCASGERGVKSLWSQGWSKLELAHAALPSGLPPFFMGDGTQLCCACLKGKAPPPVWVSCVVPELLWPLLQVREGWLWCHTASWTRTEPSQSLELP